MNVLSRRKLIIGISFGYFILVFILFFLLGNIFLKYLEFINCCFTLVLLVLSMSLLGYWNNKTSRLKSSIFFITIVSILIYFTIIYGFGLFNGFLRNSFALSFKDIINNSSFIVLTIIFGELFRYVFIMSDRESDSNLILVTVILCLLEYANCFNIYSYNSIDSLLEFLSLCLLPIVFKNASLSYVCKFGGYLPCIFYRLIIECYIYVVPIVPNLSDFIQTIFLIFLPFIIYMSVSKMINNHLFGIEHNFSDKFFDIWDIPIIFAFVLMVLFISGIGPLYLVGIASASMEPEINIGDAVLLKKVDLDDRLVVGDIIAFNKGGKVVVHRVVDIIEDNGEFYYDTKGDNNNSDDGVYLGIDEINGKYILKVPFIAKLSVWISEKKGG